MVTMSDVARAAGVSVMTVSHILNGRPRASKATRERVLNVVSELGYEINLTARNLRSGRTDAVALIVPSFHDYFGAVADRLALLLEASGHHLVLERTAGTAEHEREALSLSRLRMYDGVLLSAFGVSSAELEIAGKTVPLVLLGERDMPASLDHVRLDNEEGGRLATEHLISRGARQIAVIGGRYEAERSMASARREGWETAHREAGLACDPGLVVPVAEYSMSSARDATRALLDSGRRVDGVFAVTDIVAHGALAALGERGIRVPDDVQVVGFDDLDIDEFVTPGLTSINPNHDDLSATAVRLLNRQIAGLREEPEHVVMPVSLVVRGSTR
jgi:DNA-binding LacI/PurR family transcriptional regulator